MRKNREKNLPIKPLATARIGSDPERDAKIKDIWASARGGDEDVTTDNQAQTRDSFMDLLEAVSKTKTSQPGLKTT